MIKFVKLADNVYMVKYKERNLLQVSTYEAAKLTLNSLGVSDVELDMAIYEFWHKGHNVAEFSDKKLLEYTTITKIAS